MKLKCCILHFSGSSAMKASVLSKPSWCNFTKNGKKTNIGAVHLTQFNFMFFLFAAFLLNVLCFLAMQAAG